MSCASVACFCIAIGAVEIVDDRQPCNTHGRLKSSPTIVSCNAVAMDVFRILASRRMCRLGTLLRECQYSSDSDVSPGHAADAVRLSPTKISPLYASAATSFCQASVQKRSVASVGCVGLPRSLSAWVADVVALRRPRCAKVSQPRRSPTTASSRRVMMPERGRSNPSRAVSP